MINLVPLTEKELASQAAAMDDVVPPGWLQDWRNEEELLHPIPPGDEICETIVWRHWDGVAIGPETREIARAAHVCPHCAGVAYVRGPNRRGLYQCSNCRHQTSTVALTVLRGSRVPLWQWLAALDTYFQERNTLRPARFIELFEVKYDTAMNMIEKCRFIFDDNKGSLFPGPSSAGSKGARLLADVRERARRDHDALKKEKVVHTYEAVEWFNCLNEEQKRELYRGLALDGVWTVRILRTIAKEWAAEVGLFPNEHRERSDMPRLQGYLDLFRSKYSPKNRPRRK